jgi:ABC-type transport system substrate-binding protein
MRFFPILGTGEKTPLKTPEAAKYIRQAISHAIPRQKIMDELYLGRGFPGATVVTPLVRGFDDSLESHVYNLTKAKELMEKAGYEYPPESSTTTTTTTTTESSTPAPSFEWVIVLASMSSLSSLVTLIRRRRNSQPLFKLFLTLCSKLSVMLD